MRNCNDFMETAKILLINFYGPQQMMPSLQGKRGMSLVYPETLVLGIHKCELHSVQCERYAVLGSSHGALRRIKTFTCRQFFYTSDFTR